MLYALFIIEVFIFLFAIIYQKYLVWKRRKSMQ